MVWRPLLLLGRHRCSIRGSFIIRSRSSKCVLVASCLLSTLVVYLCINQALGPPAPPNFLFVAILTVPGNADRRDAIRNTWLSHSSASTTHKFFIGTKMLDIDMVRALEAENAVYGDIAFLDHEESYRSLAEKLVKTFQWSLRINYVYLMKVDDDTFVRLPEVRHVLRSRSRTDRLYYGFFRGNSRVKKAGQWKEHRWFLSDHYLPYAMGGGYLISIDLVQYVLDNERLFQRYSSEDVSLGVWLAPLDIERIHDVRFDTQYISRGCNNRHIVSHKQTPQDMFIKHQTLKSTGHLCEQETSKMLSFVYNWTVLPSSCCIKTVGIP